MSFKIFSDFETSAKRKFKRNNALTNITVAKFLTQSFNIISKANKSIFFSEFHTKSSRSNYIASEIVLQYLDRQRMKLTIQCANQETHSKYFRKHSDKWIQRELQLKTHLDLFAILISDRKKEMISINVLKSSNRNHNIPNRKFKDSRQQNHSSLKDRSNANNFSSSSITPSPTPSPKKSRAGEFPIPSKSNKKQWPISLSSSSSHDSQVSSSLASPESKTPPKSKKTKILNITEISGNNQFYYQKKVVDEVYDIDQSDKLNSSESLSKNESDKNIIKIHSKKANDFDSETGSENDTSKDKYSVSEIVKYRTVSTTDNSKIPRFQQLKKNALNLETTNKNQSSPSSSNNNNNNNQSVKERQVTFVDQNQNPIQLTPKLSSFKPNSSNCSNNKPLKGSFASSFTSKSNLKPSTSSLINSPKSTNNDAEKTNSNSPIQFQFETTKNSVNNQENQDIINDNQSHRKSRESRRRVRLSKNMPPKQKPVDDGDEYDIEFLREVMNEKTRSGRREKYEKYKDKNAIVNQNENNKNNKIFYKESTYEKDWDKIAYSESSSESDQQLNSSRFIKNNENEDAESKNFNLSVDDNCFYFEKEPTKNSEKENKIDVGVEVKIDSELKQANSSSCLENEIPNYYSFSLTICSAKKVIKTDLIATCDPYCKFIIKNSTENNSNDDDDIDSILSSQTKIIHDTQNPEWNETFSFNVKNVENKSISFLIFDNDLNGTDKMINSIDLPLSRFTNSMDEWLKMKSDVQVGTLTDLHIIVKANPEFGSLNDIDFRRVIKDSGETDSESDKISPIKIEEEEEEKGEQNQIEIRNKEEDDDDDENQTEMKNNFIESESKEEEESKTEIRNDFIESESKDEEEESKTEIRNNFIESESKDEEEGQTEIRNDFIDSEKEDEEESKTEIKFDSLLENESKIELNHSKTSKNEKRNEIEGNGFGLIQIEEEEEESEPEINSSSRLIQDEEEENKIEFNISHKLSNDEEENQSDFQLNNEEDETEISNDKLVNEEEDLILSEGQFEFELEEDEDESKNDEKSLNRTQDNSNFDQEKSENDDEKENDDNIISINVDIDI